MVDKICRNCIHKNVCDLCKELDLKNAIMIFDFKCRDFLSADVMEELAKYKLLKWEYNTSAFNRKLIEVKKNCEYGLTHFCDGTVNKSWAEPNEIAKPFCPKYESCELRQKKLEEITIESGEQ